MQTKTLGDRTNILLYVKPISTVISAKSRKAIINYNETDMRSRNKVDISFSADFVEIISESVSGSEYDTPTRKVYLLKTYSSSIALDRCIEDIIHMR